MNYSLMLRLVGATLVVALVESRWLNTRCRMGAHEHPGRGRFETAPYGPRCPGSAGILPASRASRPRSQRELG